MNSGVAIVFYALMAAAALLGGWWADLDLLVWHNSFGTAAWLDVLIGLGAGLVVVAASAGLERFAEWARKLSAAFAGMLGPMSMLEVTIFALTSSIGEELLFRGFFQQWLSDVVLEGPASDWWGLAIASVVFGLIHVGPDRKTFLPWTLMALVLGFALGGMYLFTGNVLAPILCHFTINFLNLAQIARRARNETP